MFETKTLAKIATDRCSSKYFAGRVSENRTLITEPCGQKRAKRTVRTEPYLTEPWERPPVSNHANRDMWHRALITMRTMTRETEPWEPCEPLQVKPNCEIQAINAGRSGSQRVVRVVSYGSSGIYVFATYSLYVRNTSIDIFDIHHQIITKS